MFAKFGKKIRRMFMQQMAPNIFVRILRGRLCLGGFGDMKWLGVAAGVFRHFFAKQVFSFRDEKPFENVCTRVFPVGAALGKNAASQLDCLKGIRVQGKH